MNSRLQEVCMQDFRVNTVKKCRFLKKGYSSVGNECFMGYPYPFAFSTFRDSGVASKEALGVF